MKQSGYDELTTITGSRGRRAIQNVEAMRNDRWVLRVILSPVMRLNDTPAPLNWIWATVVMAFQTIITDAFLSILIIAVATNVIDLMAGTAVKRKEGKFNGDLARAGMIGKGLGIAMLVLLRGLEHWVGIHAPDALHLPQSQGMIATFVALSLITVDLQSIAKHREALGSKPIPVLSQVLKWLHSLAGSKAPKGGKD